MVVRPLRAGFSEAVTPPQDDVPPVSQPQQPPADALAGVLRHLSGGTTGATGQANTGGTNIANSGVIERLTVALSAAPPQPSTTAFVSYPESDRDWVEQSLLAALDPLPMQLFYSGGHLSQPDDWEMVYAVMDKASLLIVVGRDSSVVRDRRVRDQVAYWLDNHPDRSGVVLVGQPDSRPEAIDHRLAGLPMVAMPVGEVTAASRAAAADRLVRAIRWTPRAEPGATRDRVVDEDALGPVRDAYLRWVCRTHSVIDTVVAGVSVTMPLAQCPPPGPLVRDGSSGRTRSTELDHLRSRARQVAGDGGTTPDSGAEFSVLADRPLPTYLSPTRSIDRLDLSGLPELSPGRLAGTVWRAIVLGEPGSGKSSMVRRLAYDTAARRLADDGERDEVRRLPVLCRAADLAVGLAGAEESAEGLAALAIQLGWAGALPTDPASGDRLPPDELARLARVALRSRRLVLIVDGLDEVPSLADRRSVAAALDVFAASGGVRLDHPARAPGNQTIITSRIAGYYAAALGDRFEQFLIGPLDGDGAAAVVDYWLGGYFALARVPELTQVQRRTEIEQLITGGGAAVRQLAANPYLLVSLVSVVLSGLSGRPGVRGDRWLRVDLYTAMVEHAVRRGGLRFPDVPVDTLIRLQAAVAYQMHDVSRSGLVDRATLTRLCRRALELLGEPAPPVAAEQVDPVIAGIDLLTARGQELYGFRHLTVQEYFAGRWLIDAGTVDAIVTAIGDRLGDPRWLEAIRLALGQLSRVSEHVFAAVVDELLAGPGRRLAAEMLSHSLADIAGLRRQHLRALVQVAVQTEAELTGTVVTLHPDGARMLAPLLRWTVSVQGDTAPRLICEALCEHLRDPAPAMAAAAARLIDALRLDDRSVVQALLEAQYRDSAEHGWQVTRALLTVLHRRMAAIGGGDPETVRAGLDTEQRALVDTMVRAAPPTIAAGSGRRRAGIRAATTIGVRNQMRTALTTEAVLRERVGSDLGWLRVLLCLYGGIPFLDMIHWLRRQDEAVSVFAAPTSEPAERYRAAVLLDTLIRPAIAARGPRPVAFRPEQIAIDSPLTDHLLTWLRAGVPGDDLPDLLAGILTDRRADPQVRGDALAAWLVLDTGEAQAGATAPFVELVSEEDIATVEAVRRRARWRLGRTDMLLSDALAGLNPLAAGAGLTGDASDDVFGEPFTGPFPDTFSDVVRALWMIGTPRPDSDSTRRPLSEELALAVCGANDDKEYALAVTLDVKGRDMVNVAGGLASALADVARTESVAAAGTDDWRLDPLSPPTGDLAEALTVLAGLHPRWGFLRCWCLDRLAEQIIAEGFRTEAACLALEVLVTDPTSARRTLDRLGTAAGAPTGGAAAEHSDPQGETGDVDAPFAGSGLPGDPVALSRLDRSSGRSGSAYAELRGRIRLAALLGDRWTVRVLDEALGALSDAHQRLRAIELAVGERLVAPGPELLERAVAAARQVDDPAARASALARTARWTDLDTEEGLLREALVALRGAPPDEVARVLSVLPPPTSDETRALRRRCEAVLTFRRQRSIARGDAAGALLSHDRLDRDADTVQAWAALTTAMLCRRGLDLLRDTAGRFTSERAAWSALSDLERRPAALAALRARAAAGVTALRLEKEAVAGIDALLAAEQVDDAVELLAAGRATTAVSRLRRWREHPRADLAGVATLLAIESGELDPPAVARLADLLRSEDDRIRLRTRTAIASVSRGGQGPPRLRASALGAESIVALVRLVCAARDRHPHLHGDLSWALADIVHDAPGVLRSALDLLAGEPAARRRLLVALHHLRLPVLDMLLAELPRLPDEEQMELLWALQTVAWTPSRFGMEATRLRRAAGAARRCVNESGDGPAAQALRLLGLILPVTGLSVDALLGEALSGDGLAEAACDGLGFLLHRARWEAPELDAAEAVTELWLLARDPHEPIAVAALTALARAGVTVEDDVSIAPDLVLRGLVGAVDPFVVGDQWLADLRRAARFVLHGAPVGEGADPNPLLALLLEQVVVQLVEQAEAPDRPRWDAGADYLSVLYAVAVQQPAALREAVAGEPRDLPALLLTLLGHEPGWATRSVAGALLAILGDGDAPSLRTLLDMAWDTDAVGERVLGSFRWLDRVTEQGLAELVRATADPFVARAYFAVQMLAALARQGVFGPDEQRTALAAVAGAIRRPDATRHVLLERDGRISSLGTLADACRQAIGWIESDRRLRESEAVHAGVVLPAEGVNGEPVTLRLTGEVPIDEPVRYQIDYLQQTESIELPAALTQRLGAVTAAAAGAKVPLVALVPSATDGPGRGSGSPRATGEQGQGRLAQAAAESSGMPKSSLLLVLGRNMAGEEVYSYLRVSEQQIEDVRAALDSRRPFTPGDYGTVVISGRGKPSTEVIELVGVPDFLIQFNEPTAAASTAADPPAETG